jgi:hypothetical protein
MSRLLFNKEGGAADEFGLLLPIARLFGSGVIEGMAVAQSASPAMSINVANGSAAIPTGTYPSSYDYYVANNTSGGESVTIATANTSNPRIDLIVCYVNLSATFSDSPVNNPGAMVYAAVAGTPGATPAAPNSSAIQTAIGASNPYLILGEVLVGANVTQILNSNITDLRPWATVSNMPYKFSATYAGGANISDGSAGLVPLNAESLNSGGCFNTSTGLFTAPAAGFYDFNGGAGHNNAGSYLVQATLLKNGSTLVGSGSEVTGSYAFSTVTSLSVPLNAGDTVGLYAETLTASLGFGGSNFLQGRLASRT